MNPIAEALKQLLLFLTERLPEASRPFVEMIANLIGNLNIPVGDDRMGVLAEKVAELIVDMRAVGHIEDADMAMRARLLAENRFVRVWRELGLEGI